MTQVDLLRNGIIDKLLTITGKNNLGSENIWLTKEQKKMLKMSLNDIKNGNVISNLDVLKSDSITINSSSEI